MSIIWGNSSITHTFGNVACVAMQYIKKYFEDDFFKVEHISTKLAYKQLDIFRSKTEFWKLHKPILILRPRIEMDDSSKYFYGSAMMNRMHNVRSPMEFGNTVKLMDDYSNGTSIDFLWNRYKIYYDVVMIFDTMNEQLNIAHYLTNMIVPNAPWMLGTTLESYVPKTVIYPLADYLGIPRDNTADILGYLNTYSEVPFTYKFKNGSGNDEFFALYPTNIEIIVSDLSIDDGSEKGLLTESFTISFTMSCEFNTMGCYYLILNDDKNKFIVTKPSSDIDKDGRVIPLYTIPLLFDLKLDDGWKILTAPMFIVKDSKSDDGYTLQLKKVLKDDKIPTILRYQEKMNLIRDTFIKIRVFKNDTELAEGDKGFSVDYTNLNDIKLTVYDIDIQKTYRVFIIINNQYINSITDDINNFSMEK